MYRQLFAGHSNNERDRTYMFELKDDLHVCVLVLIDCDFANLRIQSTYYIKCILPFFILYFFLLEGSLVHKMYSILFL